MKLPIKSLVALVLSLCVGCNRLPGIFQGEGPRGDGEAVHGGDEIDVVLANARERLLAGIRYLSDPALQLSLAEVPGTAPPGAEELRDSLLALSPTQREQVRQFLLRNLGALENLLSGAGAVRLLPGEQAPVLAGGRSVLAWVEANDRTRVYFHRSIVGLSEPTRLSLLLHELGHLIVDPVLGDITDSTSVPDFSSPEGSGRMFLDRAGAMLALFTARGLRPFAFAAANKVVDHGGTFLAGQVQAADINGDGNTDILLQGNDNKFYASTAKEDGNYDWPRVVAETAGSFLQGQAQYADVNGDGKQDLIFQTLENHFSLYPGTAAGLSAPRPAFQHGGTFEAGKTFYPDINGDGKADLVVIGSDNRMWLSISAGESFGAALEILSLGEDYRLGNVRFADVTGDGKDDCIVRTSPTSLSVMVSTGHNLAPESGFAEGETSFSEFALGDINGDGRIDAVLRYGRLVNLIAATPTGEGVRQVGPELTSATGELLVADLNRDGKADLVHLTAENHLHVSLANSAGFGAWRKAGEFGFPYVAGRVLIVDANGDGRKDLMLHDGNNDLWLALSTGDR